MTKTEVMIFDLSEVLIRGLYGVERTLAGLLRHDERDIWRALQVPALYTLFRDELTEEEFLGGILRQHGWNITQQQLQAVIRQNFDHEITGTVSLLQPLSHRYRLALLSDHARAWADYIRERHPFLRIFDCQFFSFEMRRLKCEPEMILMVMDRLRVRPQQCLFIDDNVKNIQVASSAGVACLHFTTAQQLRQDLARLDLLHNPASPP